MTPEQNKTNKTMKTITKELVVEICSKYLYFDDVLNLTLSNSHFFVQPYQYNFTSNIHSNFYESQTVSLQKINDNDNEYIKEYYFDDFLFDEKSENLDILKKVNMKKLTIDSEEDVSLKFGDMSQRSLEKIDLLCESKQSFLCNLPPTIKKIEFYDCYNHPLPENLPDSITMIEFGDGSSFNHPLPEKLPSSLTILQLGYSFNHPLPKKLPSRLDHLIIGNSFNHPLPENLPDSLRNLHFCGNSGFRQKLPDKLPKYLKGLFLGCEYNHEITQQLPDTLEELNFGSFYDKPLPHPLPPSLKRIKFGVKYSYPFPESFPYSTEVIIFPREHTHKINSTFPKHLIHVDFGSQYNDKFPDNLPSSIKRIYFGRNFNQPFPEEFPESLERIGIYGHNIEKIFGKTYTKKDGSFYKSIPQNVKDEWFLENNDDYVLYKDGKRLNIHISITIDSFYMG